MSAGRTSLTTMCGVVLVLSGACGRVAYDDTGDARSDGAAPALDATARDGSSSSDGALSRDGAGLRDGATDGSAATDGGSSPCGVGGRPSADDPVLHWPLDESSGDVVPDSSGNGIDGNVAGHTWLPTGGAIDGAILVPPSSDVAARSSILDAVDDSMTLALWFRDNATPTNEWRIVAMKHDFTASPREGWSITAVQDTQDIQVAIDTAGDTNQTRRAFPGVLDGNWHHLAFTLDAGTFASYVDGVQTLGGTYAHNDGVGNPFAFILATDPLINAFFDDVRYYARALSAEQIQALYECVAF